MSLGLQATKRRIASVNSTKKITKAMQLVATAKLKTMKNNLSSSTQYLDEVSFMMACLLNRLTDEEKLSLLTSPSDAKDSTCYIVISSSLGLCGGYNYNVFKEALNVIDKEKDYLLVIGSKAYTFFKNRSYHIDDTHINALNNLSYENVDAIIKHILFLYTSGKCNKISIIYTHYKNQITFIPKTISLYPIDGFEDKISSLTKKEKDMLVEPDNLSVARRLFPLYLKSVLFTYFNESLLSEYASRRNSMENATDNAEEIVEKLQIEYNKARQSAITQEITEVVGGANASK